MKNHVTVCAAALLAVGCSDASTTLAPVVAGRSDLAAAVAAVAPPPVVSGFSGISSSYWLWDKAPKYGQSWVIDYRYENQFTITGTGFGSSGTITFGNPGYRVTSIKSWKDNQIIFTAGSVIDAVPNFATGISVTRAAGNSTSRMFPVRLIPGIRTRPYGQCTYWAAYRRIKLGRSEAQPTAYSATGALGPDYVPQAYDVLWANNVHQAFIEAVSTQVVSANKDVSKGPIVREYAITLSQYNARYDEQLAPSNTLTIRVQEVMDLKSRKTVRSLVQGFNVFRMSPSVSTPATNYWR